MDYLVEKGNEGRYVALRSLLDRRIVAAGPDPRDVYQQAQAAGAAEPVLFYVPDENMDIL